MVDLNIQLPNGRTVPWQFKGETATPEEYADFQTYLLDNQLITKDELGGPSTSELLEKSFRDVGTALGDVIPREAYLNLAVDDEGNVDPELLAKAEKQERERLASQKLSDQVGQKMIDYKDISGVGDALRFGYENIVGNAAQVAPYGLAIGLAPFTGGASIPLVGAGANVAFNLPQFTANNIQRQIDEGKPVNYTNALMAGTAQTAVDTVADKLLLFTDIPSKTFLRSVVKKVGTGAMTGASSEAAQQFLERQQAGVDLTSDEAKDEYLSSALAGFAFGTVGGAAGAVHSKFTGVPKDLPTDVKDSLASQFIATEVNTLPKEELPFVQQKQYASKEFNDKADSFLAEMGVNPELFTDGYQKYQGILKLTENSVLNKDFDAKAEAVKNSGFVSPDDFDAYYKQQGVKLFDQTPEQIVKGITGQDLEPGSIQYNSPIYNEKFLNEFYGNPEQSKGLQDVLEGREAPADVEQQADVNRAADAYAAITGTEPLSEVVSPETQSETPSGSAPRDEIKAVERGAKKRAVKQVLQNQNEQTSPSDLPQAVETGKPIETPQQALDAAQESADVTPRTVVESPEQGPTDFVVNPTELVNKDFGNIKITPLAQEALNNIVYTTQKSVNQKVNLDKGKKGYVKTPTRSRFDNPVADFNEQKPYQKVGAFSHVLTSLSTVNPQIMANLPDVFAKVGFDWTLDSGLIPERLIKEASKPKVREQMKAYVAKKYKLDEMSMMNFEGDLGYREILSDVFVDNVKGRRKNKQVKLPAAVRVLFNAVKNNQVETRRALNDANVKKMSDLFDQAGGVAPAIQAATNVQLEKTRVMLEQVRNQKDLDLIDINGTRVDQDILDTEEVIRGMNAVEPPPGLFNAVGRTVGNYFTRYAKTGMWIGDNNPAIAKFYTGMKARLDTQANMREQAAFYGTPMLSLIKKAPGKADDLNRAMIRLNKEGRGFLENPDGTLTAVYEDGSREDFKDQEVVMARNGIKQYTNEVLNKVEETWRKGLKYVGIPEDLDLNQIRALANKMSVDVGLLKKTDFKGVNKYQDVLDTLNGFIDAVDGLNNLRRIEYVPRMRPGKYGISVKQKSLGENSATHLFDVIAGKNGFYDKESLNKARAKIKALVESNPEDFVIKGADGKVYDVKNIDKIVPFFKDRNEFMNDLSSRTNLENLINGTDIDEAFSNDQEYQKFIQGKLNTARSLAELRKNPSFLKADKTEGYTDDWGYVWNSYLSKSAFRSGDLLHKDDIQSVKNLLTKKLGPQHQLLVDRINSDYDFVFKQGRDLTEFLTTMNYAYSFGFSPKSALAQAGTLGVQVPSVLTTFNGSVAESLGLASRGAKATYELLDWGRLLGDVAKLRVSIPQALKNNLDNMLRSGSISPEQHKALDYFMNSSTSGDSGQELFENKDMSQKKSIGGQFREGFNELATKSGTFMAGMEQGVRLSTFLASYEMLTKNPTARSNFFSSQADNQTLQEMFKRNPTVPKEVIGAEWMTMQASGVAGKQGRAPIFRGLGRFLLPYNSFPAQMMGLFLRTVTGKMGPHNLKAATYFMGSSMALAGTAGLIGYDLLNYVYSLLSSAFGDKADDLNFLLRRTIHSLPLPDGVEDALGTFSQYGLPGLAGVDLSGTLGNQTIGLDLIKSATGKNQKSIFESLAGPLGNSVTDVRNALSEDNPYKSSVGTVIGLLPIKALRDLYKAYNMSEGGVRNRMGNKLIDSEDVNSLDVVYTMLGFNPASVSEARNERFYKGLLQTSPEYDRLRSQAKEVYTEYQEAMARKDLYKAKELNQDFQKVLRLAVREGRSQGKDVTIPTLLSQFQRGYKDKNDPVVTQKELSKPGPNSGRLKVLKDIFD